jgi:predicted enzyme related to lactoylglutathione lyase
MSNPVIGSIGWVDLTVKDAPRLRDFYKQVAGWEVQPLDRKGYHDYLMQSPDTGLPCAGICHRRGENSNLPAGWLIYITVEDLEASLAACVQLGGKLLGEIGDAAGQGRFAVIEDPSGATAALFEPAPPAAA